MGDNVGESLDGEILDSLKDMLGGSFVMILEKYLQTSDDLIEAIGAAVEAQNMQEIAIGAHTLKSSSGQIGAKRLEAFCSKIESECTQGDIESVKQLYKDIQEDYNLVSQDLKDILQPLTNK